MEGTPAPRRRVSPRPTHAIACSHGFDVLMNTFSRLAVIAVALASGAAGCAPAAPPPVAAPVATPAPAATHHGATVDSARRGYAAADVRFMHHMLMHHEQALAMTALVPPRSNRAEIRLLGERIEVSQRDESALMQQWLRRHRGQGPDAAGHRRAKPCMPTADQTAQRGGHSSPAFDRLSLADRSRHHEGALTMLPELFAPPRAGQQPEIYPLATEIDADQRAEIA